MNNVSMTFLSLTISVSPGSVSWLRFDSAKILYDKKNRGLNKEDREIDFAHFHLL